METNKDRFPLLRKILRAIGLPAEGIDDIIERILDWLSAKDEPSLEPATLPFKLRDAGNDDVPTIFPATAGFDPGWPRRAANRPRSRRNHYPVPLRLNSLSTLPVLTRDHW